jgi:hypothetical protein
VIAKHGERVKWRHKRDVVLFDGLFAYWREGGVINRTYRLSYLNGGRPPEKVLAKMRKRSGRTNATDGTTGRSRANFESFSSDI